MKKIAFFAIFLILCMSSISAGSVGLVNFSIRSAQAKNGLLNTKTTNTAKSDVNLSITGSNRDTINIDVLKEDKSACFSDALVATEGGGTVSQNYYSSSAGSTGTKVYHEFSSYYFNWGSYTINGTLTYY